MKYLLLSISALFTFSTSALHSASCILGNGVQITSLNHTFEIDLSETESEIELEWQGNNGLVDLIFETAYVTCKTEVQCEFEVTIGSQMLEDTFKILDGIFFNPNSDTVVTYEDTLRGPDDISYELFCEIKKDK